MPHPLIFAHSWSPQMSSGRTGFLQVFYTHDGLSKSFFTLTERDTVFPYHSSDIHSLSHLFPSAQLREAQQTQHTQKQTVSRPLFSLSLGWVAKRRPGGYLLTVTVFIRPSCLVQLQPERLISKEHSSPSSQGSIPHHCLLTMMWAADTAGGREGGREVEKDKN